MVSTVASSNVAPYVGPSDIAMMYSVTDVAGLNRISRHVLGNAANAMAGMVANPIPPSRDDLPPIGLTMFGVTTPLVTRLAAELAGRSIRWCSTPPVPAGSRWKSWSTRD